MKWADMEQPLAEGSYDMAVASWSSTGAASTQGIQIAMEEIQAEQKLNVTPDPAERSIGRLCRDSRRRQGQLGIFLF